MKKCKTFSKEQFRIISELCDKHSLTVNIITDNIIVCSLIGSNIMRLNSNNISNNIKCKIALKDMLISFYI